MALLSPDAINRLMIALSKKEAGQEAANAINLGSTSAIADNFPSPAVIVATSVSTTTNFGALQVGDFVVHIPAVAGNSQFGTVAVAGTLPFAAVVNDLYIVFRLFVVPTPVTQTF